MKLLKNLMPAVLLASLASAASAAPTVIYIAGSTAFRSPATAAIIDYLSNGNSSASIYAGYTGSSLLKSNGEIIANGTLPVTSGANQTAGTATIIFETYWTGSLAGLVDLVSKNNANYQYPDYTDATNARAINASAVVNSGNAYGGGSGGAAATGATTIGNAPNMIFSDSFKDTIQRELSTGATQLGTLPGGYANIAALAAACNGSTVVLAGSASAAGGQDGIGVVPFVWVSGDHSPTSVTNITQQSAKSLITTGFIQQGLLDNGGDFTDDFYLIGRNEDSGTRIGAFSESGFGVTTAPKQYSVPGTTYGPNDTTPITAYGLFPVSPLNTESSIEWNATGHSGYIKGGEVAGALEVTTNGTAVGSFNGKDPGNSGNSYFIGYLGLADALGTYSKGCKALSYNGVPYTVGAVINGEYSFWTYEHAYRRSDLTDTNTLTGINAVADAIFNGDADVDPLTGAHDDLTPTSVSGSGINFGDMQVSRGEEGSPISF